MFRCSADFAAATITKVLVPHGRYDSPRAAPGQHEPSRADGGLGVQYREASDA